MEKSYEPLKERGPHSILPEPREIRLIPLGLPKAANRTSRSRRILPRPRETREVLFRPLKASILSIAWNDSVKQGLLARPADDRPQGRRKDWRPEGPRLRGRSRMLGQRILVSNPFAPATAPPQTSSGPAPSRAVFFLSRQGAGPEETRPRPFRFVRRGSTSAFCKRSTPAGRSPSGGICEDRLAPPGNPGPAIGQRLRDRPRS